MKVADLRGVLNRLPAEGDIFIQLPDNDPPVDFFMDSTRAMYGGLIILFPIPPVKDAIWDHDNNVINWYSLDSDSPTLEGGEG
jgi:hypothetical protein